MLIILSIVLPIAIVPNSEAQYSLTLRMYVDHEK